MGATEKVLDISALRGKAGVIEVDGEQHAVYRLTGLQRRKALDPDSPLLPDGYAIIADIVPTLAVNEQHLRLDDNQVGAILLLASQDIAVVEALFSKNVESPETPTSPG